MTMRRFGKVVMLVGGTCVVLLSGCVGKTDEMKFLSEKPAWHAGMRGWEQIASGAAGVPITLQEVAQSDKYQTFIQTSAANGHPPALFTWWNGNQLTDLADAGVAADLSASWDKAIADGSFTARQRELVSVRGKPYAIPLNAAHWIVLYNTQAFRAAGIDHPPQTWAQLIEACERLKKAGYTPFNSTVSEGWTPFIWFSQLMAATDPDAFAGLADGTVPYDGPAARKAFAIWGDMYRRGYFTDPRDPDIFKHFADRSAAMFLIGDWAAGTLAARGMRPGEDFRGFLMPAHAAGVAPAVIVETSIVVASAQALQRQPRLRAAIDALMSPQASAAMSQASGIYNGNQKSAAPDAIVRAAMEDIAARKPRLLVRWWEAVPSDIQGDLVAAMGSFMLDPTPETAAKAMRDMQGIEAEYRARSHQ